jgi:tetratricopeptide (TPR) repeat protein/LPS sulfotransferase NodH
MSTRRKLQQVTEAMQANRGPEAVAILEELLERVPDHLQARWLLLQCLARGGDEAGLERQLQLLLQHAATNLEAINQVAAFLQQAARPLDPALRAYERYLESTPEAATAAFNYAWYLGKSGQFEAAIAAYRQALELGIGTPEEVHLNIANILMDHLGKPALAREHLQQALALKPDYFGAHYNLGNLAEQLGDREEAARRFERCLEVDPASEAALARLAEVHRFQDRHDPLLARLEAAARTSRDSDLHFALGRAYEHLADFDPAWRHFAQGNALDRALLPPYQQAKTEAWFRRIEDICDRDWLAANSASESASDCGSSQRPVFICGMFRTGSTLLEQILAAHPAFSAGGELEFFPRLVARELPAFPDGLEQIDTRQMAAWRQAHAGLCEKLGAPGGRLTDKRPDNFLYIGLIKALLPSAKFIVTERDWRDVAASIFGTRLGPRQNYATNLEDIAHYIALQRALVDHWESLLGDDLLRVRYEDLVSRPRDTVASLLQRLGEEWDERCLTFDRLEGSVRTASAWQVREPLHAKSIGRWKNHQRPFDEAFGPNVDSNPNVTGDA